MNYPRIVLHKGKEISLQRGHPWLFSGAISKKDKDLADGTVVEVYSSDEKYLGTGYFANGSIAVRIISFKKATIDTEFWSEKIKQAWQYRLNAGILANDTNACRLFFGEGDGAPGLILDYYDGNVILQSHAYGIYLQRQMISDALQTVLGVGLKSVYDKSSETLPPQLIKEETSGQLYGNTAEEVVIKENGHSFIVDARKGQKTGFFIDQRDNRQSLAGYCEGKSVLNTFSYTGGFSVYAAAGKATQIVSVDASEPAIAMCKRNMELNGFSAHEGFAIDAFDYLKENRDRFDVIVLDPPAFAKSRENKHSAVIGYKRLNHLAMKGIRKGGIIFTFSCSGVIDRQLFNNTITSAAIESGRNVRILKYLSQPPDHPISPFFPEGEYLKGLVLWVD
jgi:23S rRNA (cytosine1962-C5)-methyltransferase